MSSRLQRQDLHKLHGLGNDFLVWFRPELPENAADQAVAWCDRRTGLGADGLVVVLDDRVAPRFILFNSDGSRAEVSGNGLRCFGHAIAARRGVDELTIIAETDAGDRALEVSGSLGVTATVSVGMGVPGPGPDLDRLDFDELSTLVEYRRVDSIDMGNPHIVIEVDDLDSLDIATIGPVVENHFLPVGTNVHLVCRDETTLRLLIWERGAGVTKACGSGACAAGALASLQNPQVESFRVDMPGGSVRVAVTGEITLTGDSTYVAAIDAAGL